MNITSSNVLTFLAIKYKGDWDKIMDHLRNKLGVDDDELEATIKNMKCKVITYLDKEYPEQLRQVPKPPFALFYHGDISLIANYSKLVAVVGAREPSEYGLKHLNNIVKDISLDFVVVSGLAKGIDGAAHQTCIDSGGKTIAVLGCGIDQYYPPCNKKLQDIIKKDHLLISEYPEGVSSEPQNFLIRNRIVVGLSKGVLIVDCKKASGTLSSANLACTLNKDLMSIPYPIGTEFFNNNLINEGANLVETGNDVREVLNTY